MNQVEDRMEERSRSKSRISWLERITGTALILVMMCLAWMVLAAYGPGWLRLPSAEIEVAVVAGLLLASLFLVSVVSLLHTR
jgi:hypothetical protein